LISGFAVAPIDPAARSPGAVLLNAEGVLLSSDGLHYLGLVLLSEYLHSSCEAPVVYSLDFPGLLLLKPLLAVQSLPGPPTFIAAICGLIWFPDPLRSFFGQ